MDVSETIQIIGRIPKGEAEPYFCRKDISKLGISCMLAMLSIINVFTTLYFSFWSILDFSTFLIVDIANGVAALLSPKKLAESVRQTEFFTVSFLQMLGNSKFINGFKNLPIKFVTLLSWAIFRIPVQTAMIPAIEIKKSILVFAPVRIASHVRFILPVKKLHTMLINIREDHK